MNRSFFILFVLIFYSCRKDEPPTRNAVDFESNKRVFVINEGNFLSGNAKLTAYDIESNQSTRNAFETVNGFGLGDVFQSIHSFKNNFYLTINNSGKVIIVNDELEYLNEINQLNSPRYFLPINNAKAYVTDLYAEGVHIVDLNTSQVVDKINFNGWTEELIMVNGLVYITSYDSEYLYVVDPREDSKIDSIEVGFGGLHIVQDKFADIWILSGGNTDEATSGFLVEIDPITNTISRRWDFSNNESPSRLCLNASLDTLYFLNNDVYRMSVVEGNDPNIFVLAEDRNYYGIGCSPDNQIYLADAKDFIQDGTIHIFNPNGEEKNHFSSAIIPSGFFFE
ncbi:MAG: hypothetical protein MRY83_04765 [Flavobacteriales bacterium]|nr:hypothetical protein [Flavobacteriales bacterium]